ncbi:hypothetical protein I656_03104 [Geobacillus sp. WSUCF1]|nr:hypothetical protein I656_03104 [Geobacillus sp. WSUCF1]
MESAMALLNVNHLKVYYPVRGGFFSPGGRPCPRGG